MRITEKDLNAVVKRLNLMTKSPVDSYVKNKNGKFIAQVGNYHLSWAYGGVRLHRMENESGGVSTPISSGYVPKKELYYLIHSFISGISTKNNED